MSNNSNGAGERVHQYNKVSFEAGVIPPDAPIGEWEVTFVHGKGKITPTQAGDPMVTFQIRLDRAESEENENYQGTQLAKRFVFADQNNTEKRNLVRMTKRSLRDLSEATGVDLGIIPDVLNDPETDLRPFIDAIEGKSCTAWTTHNTNKKTGDTMVDVTFSKPGGRGALSSAKRETDEE